MKSNIKENLNEDKIIQIQGYLDELESIFPFDFEEYKRDFKIRAISERLFEKIVEAVVDLAFIIIKERKLKIPEDDESSFFILKENNIISLVLAKKLKDAKIDFDLDVCKKVVLALKKKWQA